MGTTSLQSHRVTILVPGKDWHSWEIWTYMYLSWAYRDQLAGLKCNGLFEAEGIIQNTNEPGMPFRNYQNNQRLKMTGIAGSGCTLVPDTSLWLSDPDRAFNCWPWVCGELLTHTASCRSPDCPQSGIFTRAGEDLVRGFQRVKYITISHERTVHFKDEELKHFWLPMHFYF